MRGDVDKFFYSQGRIHIIYKRVSIIERSLLIEVERNLSYAKESFYYEGVVVVEWTLSHKGTKGHVLYARVQSTEGTLLCMKDYPIENYLSRIIETPHVHSMRYTHFLNMQYRMDSNP